MQYKDNELMSTSLASLRKNKQTTTFVFTRSDLDSALSPLEQISLTVDSKHVYASENYSFIAKETIDNLDRTKIAGISQDSYNTDITCSQCYSTSTFTSSNLFENVACRSCQLKFRVPIETELFLYDKHIFESPFSIFLELIINKLNFMVMSSFMKKSHLRPTKLQT